MGFVIQIVAGKATVRAVVLDVPGRAGNTEALLASFADGAASGDLGADSAIFGPRDTA